jgi:hypothetical protein
VPNVNETVSGSEFTIKLEIQYNVTGKLKKCGGNVCRKRGENNK